MIWLKNEGTQIFAIKSLGTDPTNSETLHIPKVLLTQDCTEQISVPDPNLKTRYGSVPQNEIRSFGSGS